MAIVKVQGNCTGGTTGRSLAINMTTAPIAGNTLIAVIASFAAGYISVSSITQTNVVWSQVVSEQGNTKYSISIWKGIVSSGATVGVTITFANSSGSGQGASICEYSGLSSAIEDVTATNTGALSAPNTGTTATTTQADELWIGGVTTNGGTLTSPTNSFTLTENVATSCHIGYLEKIVSTIDTAYSGVDSPASCSWAGCISTFKATATVPYDISDIGYQNVYIDIATASAVQSINIPIKIKNSHGSTVYQVVSTDNANYAISNPSGGSSTISYVSQVTTSYIPLVLTRTTPSVETNDTINLTFSIYSNSSHTNLLSTTTITKYIHFIKQSEWTRFYQLDCETSIDGWASSQTAAVVTDYTVNEPSCILCSAGSTAFTANILQESQITIYKSFSLPSANEILIGFNTLGSFISSVALTTATIYSIASDVSTTGTSSKVVYPLASYYKKLYTSATASTKHLNNNWMADLLDISDYAGETITLYLHLNTAMISTTAASINLQFNIDNIYILYR